MTNSEHIKRRALELGFVKAGIARADALDAERAHLREWLGRGYHASMRWMERRVDERTDPRLLVPGAKSVIVTADNYYAPIEHSQDADCGKVSRYAWGDDYHLHTTKRIESLFERIKQIAPESEGRYYVDTGPVMEKAWAVRAGLGWQGRHTNLITREYGSWVFLAVIITTLELEYDEQMEDLCGTCTACIDACPTVAITEPYMVDATKCISYQTIEHRGEIDPGLAEKFGQWVYGCDICQDVCPWNRFARETERKEFFPREANIAPNLDELGAITQEEFSRRFSKSPIKRTKVAGLVRNARIAKKNSHA
ncbi:MAG TPA: tRNA epoxyqueuosine(34) reductase QueG [Bacteroidota bacterium]|nr:tRNA epoxyqueuosine(34) reductase QueG [Bacteroidota bacterium]